MKLIVGLGNPGPDYTKTRHNAGFMALDRLAARHAAGAVARSRFQSVTVEADIAPRGEAPARCLLMKPVTYMNLSGRAVAEAVRFYKADPSADLLVIVDDVALPCGAIRLRAEGSAGGHNGLIDIERALGTAAYPRCRVGVDPPGRIAQADYVLGRFTEAQWAEVEPALARACEAAEVWATAGITAAMNRFNARPETEGGERPAESPGRKPAPGPGPGNQNEGNDAPRGPDGLSRAAG